MLAKIHLTEREDVFLVTEKRKRTFSSKCGTIKTLIFISMTSIEKTKSVIYGIMELLIKYCVLILMQT